MHITVRKDSGMIIDSLKYNGTCSCGKEHRMVTECAVVERGCLFQLLEYLEKYGLSEGAVVVYDENTYKATRDRHPKVKFEVILNPNNLHADEHGVELLRKELPSDAKVLIAIGSGTVHDITRYCAYEAGLDFVSCPTAASVDGFCSSVASMTWKGSKKTLPAVAPKFVLADIDIFKKAPLYLAKSGFGDMIGKYVALTDWKIGHILTGEFYCDRIAEMTKAATKEVLDSAEGIISGEDAAYEKLMYGLLLSGLAIQMMGNSRPASGAEHHISHIIEMSPEGLGVCSNALHGEKVGVGTLLAVGEYHRIAEMKDIEWQDYVEYDRNYIYEMFGERLTDEIVNENENDYAHGVTADMIQRAFSQIVQTIQEMPTQEELKKVYEKLQIKASLEDIGVPMECAEKLLEYSPCVRNRLTWMRLRKCMK